MLNVVVVTYDRPEILRTVLIALQGQVEPVCVIVSDDGGRENGFVTEFDCVEKYLWSKHTTYQRVERFNEAISFIHYGSIALLDDDCIPQSSLWSRAIEEEMDDCEVLRGLTLFNGEYNVTPWFSTVNVCFRLHELKGVLNGFDDRYNGRYGYEDLDMGKQIESKGIRLKTSVNPETAIVHVGKPRGGDVTENQRRYFEKWGKGA